MSDNKTNVLLLLMWCLNRCVHRCHCCPNFRMIDYTITQPMTNSKALKAHHGDSNGASAISGNIESCHIYGTQTYILCASILKIHPTHTFNRSLTLVVLSKR
jgi:hypothetical protein